MVQPNNERSATAITGWEPPAHPWILRGLGKLAACLGRHENLFDIDSIIDKARRSSKVYDIPVDDVLEPLQILIHSYREEAALTPLGYRYAALNLKAILAERLAILDFLHKHPEVDAVTIEKPVFIVGFPRTGTTLLHRLLATLPQARPLLTYELLRPLAMRSLPFVQNSRLLSVRIQLALLSLILPDLRHIHEMLPNGPEEGLLLMSRSFISSDFLLRADLPSYEQWRSTLASERILAARSFDKRQMQLLLWQHCPDNGFLLDKSPAYLEYLDVLVRLFPDARIIQTHRHLGRALPSAINLVACGRSIFSDQVDPHRLGRLALRRTRDIVSSIFAFREKFPADRLIDVDYSHFVNDPKGTVRNIVAQFDLPIPRDLDARLGACLARMRHHKYGIHHYALEQFGLVPEDIDEIGGMYHQHFHVTPES